MHIISTVVKKPSLISRNLSEKTIYDIESYTFNSRLLLVPVDLWPATSDSFLNTTWHFSMSRDTKQNNFFSFWVQSVKYTNSTRLLRFDCFFLLHIQWSVDYLFSYASCSRSLSFLKILQTWEVQFICCFVSLTWRKLVNQIQFFLDFRDATFWHT